MKIHKQCYNCYTSLDNVKRCIRGGHKVLILMRGVPGSGKTYLAKELYNLNNDGIICSTDDYFIDKNGTYIFNHGLLGDYHKKNMQKARDAILKGTTPVIIDNTNIKLEDMKPYVAQAALEFYEVYVVEPTTFWRSKAGQCAQRNIHGVSKERIALILDQLDLEQDPPLQSLLGKNYMAVIDPIMEDVNMEVETVETLLPSSSGLLIDLSAPPGLPIPDNVIFRPIVSMMHTPKPTKEIVTMREIATQTTDVTVALSEVGLSDIIIDVFEGESKERERMVERPETKERHVQFPLKTQKYDENATELDLLVSIYPSEDMSTLFHNYQQYGLINTIKMNCDVGLMPDHTAEVVQGSFNREVAKALETGSFDHEFIYDSISDTNTTTTTTDSDRLDEVSEQVYEVDIGTELFKQLENHFGSENEVISNSTKAFLPESLLRKIYDAVLHRRVVAAVDGPSVDEDAAYARNLQKRESRIVHAPRFADMNGAQHIQFKSLIKDYPGFDESSLRNLYESTGFNSTTTRALLAEGEFEQANKTTSTFTPVAKTPIKTPKQVVKTTKTVAIQNYPSPSKNTKYNHSRHFDEAHQRAQPFIEQALVYKAEKDRYLQEAYKWNSASGLKNIHSVVHRERASNLARKEQSELQKARDILYEANRKSSYLDLHYLSQQDSLKIVRERLNQLDRSEEFRKGPSMRKLTIVTGYGKNSGEREIVKKFISSWLNSKQYEFYFSNKGSIEVTCK